MLSGAFKTLFNKTVEERGSVDKARRKVVSTIRAHFRKKDLNKTH